MCVFSEYLGLVKVGPMSPRFGGIGRSNGNSGDWIGIQPVGNKRRPNGGLL